MRSPFRRYTVCPRTTSPGSEGSPSTLTAASPRGAGAGGGTAMLIRAPTRAKGARRVSSPRGDVGDDEPLSASAPSAPVATSVGRRCASSRSASATSAPSRSTGAVTSHSVGPRWITPAASPPTISTLEPSLAASRRIRRRGRAFTMASEGQRHRQECRIERLGMRRALRLQPVGPEDEVLRLIDVLEAVTADERGAAHVHDDVVGQQRSPPHAQAEVPAYLVADAVLEEDLLQRLGVLETNVVGLDERLHLRRQIHVGTDTEQEQARVDVVRLSLDLAAA